MSRWKRQLIWLATFCAGAIYILAFMLPAEIGGGLDRHGTYAATLVGGRLFYTTGVRESSAPLSEHEFDCEIAMVDLNAAAIRKVIFLSSVFRADDFRGMKRPVVFETSGGFKMLTIGVGKDDKNRICLADSVDGTVWNPRSKAVFEAPAQSSPRGMNWFYAFAEPNGYRLVYKVLLHGSAVLHSAYSTNLENWTDEGLFFKPDGTRSVVSFSVVDESRFSIIEKSADGQLLSFYLDRSTRKYSGMNDDVIRAHAAIADGSEIVELMWLPDHRMMVTFGAPPPQGDGRLKLAILETSAQGRLVPVRNSQPDGSVLALGSPAFNTRFGDWSAQFSEILPVIVAFGFLLGLINVCRLHFHRLSTGPDRAFSAVTLISAAVMMVAETGFRITNSTASALGKVEDFLFMQVLFPLGGTVFGLLSAYLISASFRAFRIRSWEASVLTVVAAIVLITQVPSGQLVGAAFGHNAQLAGANIDQQIREFRTWVLLVPNDAVQRAIGFGVFIGALAMAVRTWLSLDRTTLE